METKFFRLLALVPHRDARLPLRAWSAALFAAGLPGAWSFPWVAPLAQARRPLSGEELKSLAHALRRHINSEGGKLTAGPPVQGDLSAGASIFGPSLPLKLTDSFYEAASDAIASRFSPPVLGAALLHGPLPAALPAPPPVSFRAAALANMDCRFSPLGDGGEDGYFLEWRIGKLHWLPRREVGSNL